MPLEYVLKRYQKNKRELALIDASLDRLNTQLEEVPVVSGKVTKSSDDFPYIEEHIPVEMAEPEEADRIREKISRREARRRAVVQEMDEAEGYIEGMPEGMEKEIFEMVFLDGMTQQEVGEVLDRERSGISKKINAYFKLSQLSHL